VTVVPHDALLNRLRAKFVEMSSLWLKAKQVQRLCGIEPTMCQLVLDSLVDEKFLCVRSDGAYARLTDRDIAHRAYDLYLARGEHGHDVEDWLQAERELVSRAVSPSRDLRGSS
jgi:hypothetical protein